MGGRREDRDQLAEWLTEGYATAYRTAYGLLHDRADAEDAVQEALLRAWRFRAAVPSGPAVSPWLYRVVVNAALSRRRGDARYRATVAWDTGRPAGGDLRRPAWGPGTVADPERSAEQGEVRHRVLVALAGLPEHLRVVVVLRYYAGLTEAEIAAVIRRRPGTVKSRLHEARSRLGADQALGALAGAGVASSDGANTQGGA